MKAFEEAEMAKERRGRWWAAKSVDSSDEEGPMHPQRFKRTPGSKEAVEPQEIVQGKKPSRSTRAEKPRSTSQGMNPNVDWDAMIHETHFTDDEPDQPVDSTGHDEVVYVGSVGGTP